jgi:hypothetical protein
MKMMNIEIIARTPYQMFLLWASRGEVEIRKPVIRALTMTMKAVSRLIKLSTSWARRRLPRPAISRCRSTFSGVEIE